MMLLKAVIACAALAAAVLAVGSAMLHEDLKLQRSPKADRAMNVANCFLAFLLVCLFALVLT